jgi:translation initiation factor IF-2
MVTEVKKTGMTVNIAELAKSFGTAPGTVYGVLNDLDIEHDGLSFEGEDDVVELVREALAEVRGSKALVLRPNATPRDLSLALGVPQQDVQKTLLTKLKTMATLTTALKPEIVQQLVESFGYTATIAEPSLPKPTATAKAGAAKTGAAKGGAMTRPPVVTIMGHVDHGKTSLLDYIRKANVAAKEFGGITQHIGAYQVTLPEGKITFLDTPGHAAFTAMRARGASVTDIAILVVAADDGIMPTTREAIQHAKSANVPIIVAVNKIDRPDANPDRVLQQLPEFEIIPEAYGGQTITCNVSAITGEGIPHLLEMILLQAEIMDLKADPKGELKGTVIEAKMERGRGPVATVLVQNGTLKVGDSVVVGTTFGRLKAMTDYLGERITEAGPSVPAEILGLSDVPGAGDRVEAAKDERTAREIAVSRQQQIRSETIVQKNRGLTLRDLRERMSQEGLRQLNLIIKADVQGSVEAVKGMLENLRNEEVETKIILSGVGAITESDILLADASQAIVIGFNVRPEGGAKREAERHKVEIRTYNIIYELIEDIEAALKGMLEPKFEEQYLGTLEVRVRFQFSKKGIIAGSLVTDGKITRNAKVRVRRNKVVVHEGQIATLRHLKDDVREVTMGMECGVTFQDWQDFAEGDVVEAYEMVQVNA